MTLSSGGLLMRVGCRWGGSGTVKSRKLREGSWRLQAGSACPFGRLGGKANPARLAVAAALSERERVVAEHEAAVLAAGLSRSRRPGRWPGTGR